ncbi:MAG: Fe-S-binding domain-containing protein [Acidobacteriia bacterium 12-62-4]|nr:MAG: Fe-S-binding domain-containing protein [Acidobacteriia bacterium 12-62-4]
MPWLTALLALPLVGLIVLLAIPGKSRNLVRFWANAVLVVGLGLALPLWQSFDRSASGYQFVDRMPWIPTLGAQFLLGIDGISLLLVLLTSVLGPIAALASWNAIEERTKEFYAMLLLLQFGMLGLFLSLDLLLFFVFFEVVLVPMYFLIGIWGGERRLYAAIKFFLYTLAGSVVLLLGIIALYWQGGLQLAQPTFEITELLQLQLPLDAQRWLFWAFFVGFAIKVPMVPFHTWLPDAHTEAPTAGSVLLAGVLLKMGTYGFVRISLPLFPEAAREAAPILAVLSIVAILYGALISLMQQDWKRLVAYSSVSHMGFCTLGLAALNSNGIAGSVLQQVNHGISTSLLFLLVGFIYERRHTRQIADFGGLAIGMPRFAFVFAVAVFSSAGLPLLNGFIGEFTILQGAFIVNRTWAAFAVFGIVLGAAYLLWLYQRTMLGDIRNEANRGLPDLSLREWATVLPLLGLALAIGVYPKPWFAVLERPVLDIAGRLAR